MRLRPARCGGLFKYHLKVPPPPPQPPQPPGGVSFVAEKQLSSLDLPTMASIHGIRLSAIEWQMSDMLLLLHLPAACVRVICGRRAIVPRRHRSGPVPPPLQCCTSAFQAPVEWLRDRDRRPNCLRPLVRASTSEMPRLRAGPCSETFPRHRVR